MYSHDYGCNEENRRWNHVQAWKKKNEKKLFRKQMPWVSNGWLFKAYLTTIYTATIQFQFFAFYYYLFSYLFDLTVLCFKWENYPIHTLAFTLNIIISNYWTRLSQIPLFVSGEQINYWLRQIIDLLDTDKSWYFAITEFNNCFIIQSLSGRNLAMLYSLLIVQWFG